MGIAELIHSLCQEKLFLKKWKMFLIPTHDFLEIQDFCEVSNCFQNWQGIHTKKPQPASVFAFVSV